MSQIFLSYASVDRDRARLVADSLTQKGWAVWWDRTILPGKEFDQVIEQALDGAKCAVVLWSSASTTSTWVKTEAAEAMRRQVLVPALIDDTKIPLEFRRLQAADLSQWQGELDHPEFEKLSKSIRSIIEGLPPLPQDPDDWRKRKKPAPPPGSKQNTAVYALAGVIVVLLVAFFGYQQYRQGELERRLAASEQERLNRDLGGGGNGPVDPDVKDTSAALEENRRAEDARARAARDEADRREAARREADRREAERRPRSLDVRWNDNSLRYSGTLHWTADEALLNFTAFDARTGFQLGTFTFPAEPPEPGETEYFVSGAVAVAADSTTPYPHQHFVNLSFNSRGDGSLRFVQNCPRPGECYSTPVAGN